LKNVGLDGEIEDSAIIPVPNSDLVLVKNIDIFTPILDEPEIMGEIAAANVTNDIYAMNVLEISGMLVFLGLKTNMPLEIAEGILQGIKQYIEKKLNSKILGGHTIYSEWPLIGGEASGFLNKNKVIKKNNVKENDLLILTKPIGNQASMAAYRLQKTNIEMLEQYSHDELETSIDLSIKLMTTPLKDVVKIIHSYEDLSFIHSMTDISGFGLAGHLKEILLNSQFSANINLIPYIKLTRELALDFGYKFEKLLMPETAGGMLISINKDHAQGFSEKLKNNGVQNWIIGEITKDRRNPKIRISENVQLVEVIKY